MNDFDYTDNHVKLTRENPRCDDFTCEFPRCVYQRRQERIHEVLTRCGERGIRGVLVEGRCKHYE